MFVIPTKVLFFLRVFTALAVKISQTVLFQASRRDASLFSQVIVNPHELLKPGLLRYSSLLYYSVVFFLREGRKHSKAKLWTDKFKNLI